MLVAGSQNLAFGHLELSFGHVSRREQIVGIQAFATGLQAADLRICNLGGIFHVGTHSSIV